MIASMLKRHRFPFLALCIGVLVLSGYVLRERLERALIAASIYRAHIMTQPAIEPEISPVDQMAGERSLLLGLRGYPHGSSGTT